MFFISRGKLFSFSRYLNFCFDFSFMQKNGFMRNIRFISTFMTSQTRKQTITIHILSNTLRIKANNAMKFAQLIECSVRNIFLEKSYTEFSEETIPRLFSKKSTLSISLDQQSKVSYSQFVLYAKLRAILKLSYKIIAINSYKTFLKNKKRFGTCPPTPFFR